eukprot:IDg2766t1
MCAPCSLPAYCDDRHGQGSWTCRSCLGSAQGAESDLVISLALRTLVRIGTAIQAPAYISTHRRALGLPNSFTHRGSVCHSLSKDFAIARSRRCAGTAAKPRTDNRPIVELCPSPVRHFGPVIPIRLPHEAALVLQRPLNQLSSKLLLPSYCIFVSNSVARFAPDTEHTDTTNSKRNSFCSRAPISLACIHPVPLPLRQGTITRRLGDAKIYYAHRACVLGCLRMYAQRDSVPIAVALHAQLGQPPYVNDYS